MGEKRHAKRTHIKQVNIERRKSGVGCGREGVWHEVMAAVRIQSCDNQVSNVEELVR